MNKFKRMTAVLLSVIMLLSATACGKSDNNTTNNNAHVAEYGEYDETKYNKPGEFPIFKDKQTITVQIAQSAYVEDYDTNVETKLLEEKLNADLVFSVMPSKEYNTKVNLMVAAGGDELSDAIIGTFTDSVAYNYALNGAIADLTDYFNNSSIGYWVNEAKTRVGFDYTNQVTMPDGKIYYVPSLNMSVGNVNPHKMYVYAPWAEKLGINLDDVKTPEDFEKMLLEFKDKDANGNGKKDEIGISSYSSLRGWFCYLMNPYVYAGDPNYMTVEDGELSFAFQQEGWRDGLRYIKKLYDEGLIDPAVFSQDKEAYKSLLNSETTVVDAFCDYGADLVASNDKRRVEYQGIAPLENADGKKIATYRPAKATARFLVSAKANDIENAFRLGDLKTSEELSIHTRWGLKGTDWLEATDSDVASFAALGFKPVLKEVLGWSILQNENWAQQGPYIRQEAIMGGVVSSGDPLDHTAEISKAQLLYQGNNPDEVITKLIYNEEEDEQATERISALKDYVNEMTANFVTGVNDLDKDWQEFQDQIVAIGAEEAIIASQSAYDRFTESK